VLIRTRVSEIREMGRATQGVTLISLDEGTKLSGLQHIAEAEAEAELDEADAAANGSVAQPDDAENGEDGEGA
jgi:DNA gyrase subunit A